MTDKNADIAFRLNANCERVAVYLFARHNADEIRNSLKGRNLACWCEPGQPGCHADALLAIANEVKS